MGRKHNPVTDAAYYARHRVVLRKKQRAYYQRCRAVFLKREAGYRKAKREEIRKLKEEPCTDCGGRFHFSAMDFDHVRGEKKFEISRTSLSTKHILEEVAKCEIVCSNCHRVRTYKRRHGQL